MSKENVHKLRSLIMPLMPITNNDYNELRLTGLDDMMMKMFYGLPIKDEKNVLLSAEKKDFKENLRYLKSKGKNHWDVVQRIGRIIAILRLRAAAAATPQPAESEPKHPSSVSESLSQMKEQEPNKWIDGQCREEEKKKSKRFLSLRFGLGRGDRNDEYTDESSTDDDSTLPSRDSLPIEEEEEVERKNKSLFGLVRDRCDTPPMVVTVPPKSTPSWGFCACWGNEDLSNSLALGLGMAEDEESIIS